MSELWKQIEKMMDDSWKENQIRLREQKIEQDKWNKEWAAMMRKEHLRGSVKIGRETYLSFKEYDEFISTVYGDHCYLIPSYSGTWMSGKVLREMSSLTYRYWAENRWPKYIKLFEDGDTGEVETDVQDTV